MRRSSATSTPSLPSTGPCSTGCTGLVLAAYPDAAVVISYRIPTYRVGRRRLYIGAWQHGLSVYGWPQERDDFTARHPELKSSKGTIRLRPQDAAGLPDDELRDLIRAALEP